MTSYTQTKNTLDTLIGKLQLMEADTTARDDSTVSQCRQKAEAVLEMLKELEDSGL